MLWKDKPFKEWTEEDIKEFFLMLKDKKKEQCKKPTKISPYTYLDYQAIIQKFFKWLSKADIVDYSLERPDYSYPKELLSSEDVTKMIDVVDSPKKRALIALLFESGARVAEIGLLK